MVSRLKQRIADILFPGWSGDELVTSMLEHQARIRADPERQRFNREINRQLSKELALGLLVITCVLLVLLVGSACWFAQVPVLIAVQLPLVHQLAAAIAASAGVSFLLARPWR